MEYEAALNKAFLELTKLTKEKNLSLRFLEDNYTIDLEKKQVLSLSCNAPAKVYYSIVILHYLIRKLKGLPGLTEKWISFKELSGGPGYYPTFKKRVIDVIMRKYSAHPDALFDLGERFQAKKAQVADVSVVLDVFEKVPFLITFWRGDDEFGPETNVLFDQSISDILCTEDIVVVSEIIAHSI